jgi:thiol:disulfide interchange protein
MAYRDAAVTDFLGGFFTGLLIVLVTTACFAGFVAWSGQTVQPTGAPVEQAPVGTQ